MRMNAVLRKDGIYIVLLAGTVALWLAMAFSVPAPAGADRETKQPPKQDVTQAMASGKINPALALFLFVLCAAGCGTGLVADIVLFLKRRVRGEQGEAAAAVGMAVRAAVPWHVSDIFRFFAIFVFLVSAVHAGAYILLVHKVIGRPAAETGVLVAGTFGVYCAMLWLMHRVLIKGYAADVSQLGISLKGFFRNARDGIIGYIAFVPAFFLLLIVSLLVCQLLGIKPQAHELVEIFSAEESPWTRAYLVVLAAGFAPVYEEIVFRGFIYGVLRKYAGVSGGMALSGFFFAAIHFNAAQFIPVWGLGIMLAYLYEKTGTLVAPVVFHAVNNGIAVAITLLLLKTM